MFDPSFFNFDFFGFALMASTVIPPLFGDREAWLPDFLKVFGTYIKDGFANISSGVKGFIEFATQKLADIVKSLYDGIVNFFTMVWEGVKSFFTYIKEAVIAFFERLCETVSEFCTWLAECLTQFYERLGQTLSDLWDLLSETVTNFCDWRIETVFYAAECVFEYLLQFLDWFAGVMVEMFEWLLGTLPSIELPSGFEEGLPQLISYGMIVDKIFPLKEMLGLLSVYVLILVCLTLYKFVKSWIPLV